MKIPIHNSIFSHKISFKTKPLNLKIMNNLNLLYVDQSKFPTVKILNNLPIINSLYETVLLTINDYLVNKFLEVNENKNN